MHLPILSLTKHATGCPAFRLPEAGVVEPAVDPLSLCFKLDGGMVNAEPVIKILLDFRQKPVVLVLFAGGDHVDRKCGFRGAQRDRKSVV